jgi:hypothetical protein
VKIIENPPIQPWPGSQTGGPSPKETGQADFAQALAERSAQATTPSNASAQIPAPLSFQPADPLGKIMASAFVQPLGEVERTFGLLERYQEALADPTVTLKQVSGQVQALEQASTRLLEMGQALPEDSPAYDLINRTAILAAVEAAKFRRGDYV